MANNLESANLMESAAEAFLDCARIASKLPMHREINRKSSMMAQ